MCLVRDKEVAPLQQMLSARLIFPSELFQLNYAVFNLLAASLGFSLKLVVDADTLDESLTGLRLAHVLNADVDSLGNNAGVDTLVDDDTD